MGPAIAGDVEHDVPVFDIEARTVTTYQLDSNDIITKASVDNYIARYFIKVEKIEEA